MVSKIPLSIVLPVHNESGCIASLLREIVDVCVSELHVSAEVIVVDDASDDDSAAIVDAIASEVNCPTEHGNTTRPFIRLIRHAVCIGQSGTLMDGFVAAKGEIIISMDADGQFDPHEIPRLLQRMDSCDMVCGVRHRRRDGLIRKGCSVIANSFRNLVTRDSISDAGCTFRSMRSCCVKVLLPFQGKLSGCEFFFHPLMVRNAGFRIGEIDVRHRPRAAGKSNYRLLRGRMGRGFRACIRVRDLLRRCPATGCPSVDKK